MLGHIIESDSNVGCPLVTWLFSHVFEEVSNYRNVTDWTVQIFQGLQAAKSPVILSLVVLS